MSKTWGFFFVGSGYGPEPSCQILAYYKFFPGKSYFYRTITQTQVLILKRTPTLTPTQTNPNLEPHKRANEKCAEMSFIFTSLY